MDNIHYPSCRGESETSKHLCEIVRVRVAALFFVCVHSLVRVLILPPTPVRMHPCLCKSVSRVRMCACVRVHCVGMRACVCVAWVRSVGGWVCVRVSEYMLAVRMHATRRKCRPLRPVRVQLGA